MKRILVALTVLCFTPAFAAPFIGSKAPFLGSTYCNQMRCTPYNVQALSSTLSQETYYFEGPLTPDSSVLYVLRDAGRVVSVGYSVGAQGTPFRDNSGFGGPSDSPTKPRNNDPKVRAAELIKLATGIRPSDSWMIALECPNQATKAGSSRSWKGLTRVYTVTCISNPISDYIWTQVRVF